MQLNFIGDIGLNNRYENVQQNPFNEIGSFLASGIFTIGNLECMAKGQKENKKKFPRLGTETKTLNKLLPSLHLNLVTLAHNHFYDNLEEGYLNTITSLDKLGISHIGTIGNNVFLYKNEVTFCFLNYVTQDTHPSKPDEAKIDISYYDRNRVIEDIRKYHSKVDFVICLFHWGGDNEGYMYPNLQQRNDAHAFIEEGADLIVGGAFSYSSAL